MHMHNTDRTYCSLHTSADFLLIGEQNSELIYHNLQCDSIQDTITSFVSRFHHSFAMLSWLWTNYVPLHCNCVKFTIIGCDPVASTDTLVHANRPRLELHVMSADLPPYTLPHCGPASDWCCIIRHDTVQLARESKQDQTPDKTNSQCNLMQSFPGRDIPRRA